MRFARYFPAWCTNGEPRSWRHWRYGLATLAREQLRAEARAGRAARAGQYTNESFDTWIGDLNMITDGR